MLEVWNKIKEESRNKQETKFENKNCFNFCGLSEQYIKFSYLLTLPDKTKI